MYAVVGCSECDALWVVEGRPETTECRRCGTRHRFDLLERFVETDDRAAAREARARMLAERSGEAESFDAVGSFEELESEAETAGVDDDEYLRESGVDAEEVAAAGERVTQSGGSRRRREVVVDAVHEQDAPTEREVVDYAEAHGVPADAARDLLEKLVRAGEVSEHRGEYRSV
ncbi:replication protein H [Halobacteriales archaeon QS_1_68_20]|nr:MAG: replication protein H [Halobacteriales archaeon QS_1_68_20]